MVGNNAVPKLSAGKVGPSRSAIPRSSRTTDHNPSITSPVHAALAPARISVLPKLNSFTGIPKPIATSPANRQPIPASNITTIIKPTLGPQSQRSRTPDATIPSYCASGQPTIAGVVPAMLHCTSEVDQLGKLRHNSQLLGNATALYGSRGKGPRAPIGPEGHRVTNSNVIRHYLRYRYAVTALGGANLR
jgi:hypothetical protein